LPNRVHALNRYALAAFAVNGFYDMTARRLLAYSFSILPERKKTSHVWLRLRGK
jgi:hypothetical protein